MWFASLGSILPAADGESVVSERNRFLVYQFLNYPRLCALALAGDVGQLLDAVQTQAKGLLLAHRFAVTVSSTLTGKVSLHLHTLPNT